MATPRFLDRTTPPHIATLILITSLATLSLNLFLPSLPAMTEDFATSYGIVQIAVAGYMAVNAVVQLVIGPVSDRYGRRNVLMACIAIFALASVGCALSTDIVTFLVFRMIQAAIVAGIVLPRAAIRDQFAQDRAASMIGYVTMGMSVAPMLAPAVGGLLQGAFGWQANFWAMAILGVLCLWLVRADMGETAVSSGLTLRQQVGQYPELLRSPRFWGYALACAFSSGAFFAYLGGAPYVGSEVHGLSPTILGIFFGAPAIGYMIGNGISGRYANHFGINAMILTGAIFTLLGLAVSLGLSMTGISSPWVFFGFMTFVGLGNGLVIPNATAGALSVRPRLAGTASGLSGAIMIGGGALFSALAGVLMTGATSEIPLNALMTAASALCLVSIFIVFRREAQLRARGELVEAAAE